MKAHLSKRITTWFVSVILFLFASAVLIFYATGFSYDFKNHKIVKTGMIYLTVDPGTDLEVSVDGRVLSSKSPAKLAYLIPGRHKIVIKKQGYNDWSKDYDVESGKVISDYNITLFFKKPESKLIEKNINGFSLSKNKDKIIYWTSDNQIFIASFDNALKNKKLIAKNLNNINSLIWSLDQNKAVFMADYNWYLLDYEKQSLSKTNLSNTLTKEVHIINNKLFYLSGSNLYYYDFDKKLSQKAGVNVYSFIELKNSIIASNLNNQKYCLSKINSNSYNIEKITCINYKIIKIKNIDNTVLALDSAGNLNKLESSFKFKEIGKQVVDFTWSKFVRIFLGGRGKTGSYYINNLGEFYFYSDDESKNYFITRLSANIDSIIPYLNGDVLVFSSDNELLTLDGSGVNQYKIADILNNQYSFVKDINQILVLTPSNNLELLKIR